MEVNIINTHPLLELETYLDLYGDKYNIDIDKNNVYFICKTHGTNKIVERKDMLHKTDGLFCRICRQEATIEENQDIDTCNEETDYTLFFSPPEQKIEKILIKNGFNFIREKIFPDCVNEKDNKLRFDFYLPYYNFIIEYDGEQHFKPVKKYGGVRGFEKRQHHDKIKNDYCYANNIRVLRLNMFHLRYNKMEEYILNEIDSIKYKRLIIENKINKLYDTKSS